MPTSALSNGYTDSMANSAPQGATMNIVPSLGNRFMLQIDTDWLARYGQGVGKGWSSPLGSKLEITFYNFEDGIVESGSVNYADADIIGRAEQIKSYVGTGNREIPLTFQFQAQGAEDSADDIVASLTREVLYPAKWLDALKHPYIDQQSGLSHPPPPVLLTVGGLLTARCLATDVQVTWKPPFHPVLLLPYAAEVTCTFTVVRSVIGNYQHNSQMR